MCDFLHGHTVQTSLAGTGAKFEETCEWRSVNHAEDVTVKLK